MKIHKYDAINALYEGNVTQLSDGTFEYHSGGSIPSEEAIQAKISELQAEYDALQYQRDRANTYPAIGDQLDMLFHAIDAGKVDKTSDFYKSLKAVKDKYPKG